MSWKSKILGVDKHCFVNGSTVKCINNKLYFFNDEFKIFITKENKLYPYKQEGRNSYYSLKFLKENFIVIG